MMRASSTRPPYEIRDFPASVLSQYDIETQHPDIFLLNLLNLKPNVVCATIRQQRLDLKNPPKPIEDLLDTFVEQGLKQSVVRLHSLVSSL